MYTLTTRSTPNPSLTLYHSAERLLQTVAAIDTPTARYYADRIRNVLSGDICGYSDAMDVLNGARLAIEEHRTPKWPVELRF